MPDTLLLSRARHGDQEAVAELYRDHVGAALRYARAIAPSVADAEDLVAESFARVIAQLALDRGPDSSFRAYLFTTMRHRLYSTNRREYAVADDSVLDRPTEDRADEVRADHAILKEAFDSLAKQEQEVLLLLDVQELRPSEVCDRLGLRASALSMRVARARSALAEAYLVAHVRPAEPGECQATRQQLGRHVRGKLSSLRSRQVTAHLGKCVPCTDAMTEVTKVNRSLRAIPIFGLPTARPRGWRAVLHVLRGSHAGAAPTAAKIAVVAAAITAGSGAAAVLVSNTSHPSPGPSHVAVAAWPSARPSATASSTSPVNIRTTTVPGHPTTAVAPAASPALALRTDGATWPAVRPHKARVAPAVATSPVNSPSPASTPGPSATSVVNPSPSTPANTESPTESPTPSATPTSSPTDSPSPTSTDSASDTPSESPTPTESDSTSPPTCEIFDLDCWWVSAFG